MQKFDLILFADYFQFYLQDEPAAGDLAKRWTDEAVRNLLALAPGVIAIGTVRNMPVPVTIEIRDSPPDEDSDAWDQINECSLEIRSGTLVVAGCTDYFPDALRIQVKPGPYRARIFYANLDSLSENGLAGEDTYKVVLWPAPSGRPVVIKRRRRNHGS